MPIILLPLLSLVLTCLSNPGMPAPWLAWFALIPLFFAAENLRLWPRTLAFGLWGLLWWCWSVWWLVPAVVKFSGLDAWRVVMAWLAMCVVLSAPYWLIGLLWGRAHYANRLLRCIVQALLFTVSVSLLTLWIPASIASSQYVYTPLIQIVDLGGTALLLFVLVFINLLLTQAVRFTKRQSYFLAAALVIIGALASYGQYRIADTEKPGATTLTVGYVQPNLAYDDNIDSLLQQTRELARSEPDIDVIAWPPFVPALSWSENLQDRARVNALLREIGKPLLLSSSNTDASNRSDTASSPRYGSAQKNVAQLISAQGKLLGTYYPQQTLSLLAYLPIEQQRPTLQAPLADNIVGSNDQPLALNNEIRVAPLLGYEMIFPAIAAHQIDNGANVFINLTDDDWLGNSRGAISHLALAQFRAIEHHRPWIRVSNAGISTATNASGSLLPLASIAPGERDAHTITVGVPSKISFYSAYPNAFLAGAVIALLLALGFKRRRVNRTVASDPEIPV